MSNIVLNVARHGNFTSSEIVDLTTEGKTKGTWGKPALTYIEEKNMERRLGRSISSEVEAKPTTWGSFMESIIQMQLKEYYSFNGTETLLHPLIENWAGSPDGYKLDNTKTVVDFKAPYTLKSFCQLVQPIYDGLEGVNAMNKIRDTHKDGEKFYWQLISNACITGSKWAELIVYCPYESEIPAILHAANKSAEPNLYWIANALPEQLPYIKDDGYYSSLNIIRFEVPEEDKQKLEQLVVRASELLIKMPC